MGVNYRKEMIICGGENIYPKEIGACLLTHRLLQRHHCPLQNPQIFQICGRMSQNGNRKNQKSGNARNKYQRAGT